MVYGQHYDYFGDIMNNIPQSEFLEHLKRAGQTVHTWPTWKQEVLGGKANIMTDNEKHKKLIEDAEDAIGKLSTDLTVSRWQTKDDLMALKTLLETLLTDIEYSIAHQE